MFSWLFAGTANRRSGKDGTCGWGWLYTIRVIMWKSIRVFFLEYACSDIMSDIGANFYSLPLPFKKIFLSLNVILCLFPCMSWKCAKTIPHILFIFLKLFINVFRNNSILYAYKIIYIKQIINWALPNLLDRSLTSKMWWNKRGNARIHV